MPGIDGIGTRNCRPPVLPRVSRKQSGREKEGKAKISLWLTFQTKAARTTEGIKETVRERKRRQSKDFSLVDFLNQGRPYYRGYQGNIRERKEGKAKIPLWLTF